MPSRLDELSYSSSDSLSRSSLTSTFDRSMTNDSYDMAESAFRPLVPQDFRRRARERSGDNFKPSRHRPGASVLPHASSSQTSVVAPPRREAASSVRSLTVCTNQAREPLASSETSIGIEDDLPLKKTTSFSESRNARVAAKKEQLKDTVIKTVSAARSSTSGEELAQPLLVKPEPCSPVQSVALREEAERDWQACWQRQHTPTLASGRRVLPETVQAAVRSGQPPSSPSLGDGKRSSGLYSPAGTHGHARWTSVDSTQQRLQLKRHSSDNLGLKARKGDVEKRRSDSWRKPMSVYIMQNVTHGIADSKHASQESLQRDSPSPSPSRIVKSMDGESILSQGSRSTFAGWQERKASIIDDAGSPSIHGSTVGLLHDHQSSAQETRKGSKASNSRGRFRTVSAHIGLGLRVGDGSSSSSSKVRKISSHSEANDKERSPRLEMRNDLTSDERREQLRRAQKLASLLGGEVLAGSDNKEVMRGFPGLPRRQSEPDVSMSRTTSSQNLFSRMYAPDMASHDAAVPSATKSRKLRASRKRSRSALGLVGREDSLHASWAPLPTQLPLDIHPKAAAILGLTTGNKDTVHRPSAINAPASPKVDHHRDGPLGLSRAPSVASESVVSWVASQRGQEPDQASGKDGSTERSTLISARDSIEVLESDDNALSDDQSQELEDEAVSSKSLRTDEHKKIGAGHRRASDPVVSSSLSCSAPSTREERRKRVTKITRWLGDVVPAHLVQHTSESQQVPPPAYFFDEMPSSTVVDFASGTPLATRSPSSSSSLASAFKRGVESDRGLTAEGSGQLRSIAKARDVLDAKLARSRDGARTPLQINTSIKNLDTALKAPNSAPAFTTEVHCLTAEERAKQVKSASKLASLFGELPPSTLLATCMSSEAGKLSLLGMQDKLHRSTPSLGDSTSDEEISYHSFKGGLVDARLPSLASSSSHDEPKRTPKSPPPAEKGLDEGPDSNQASPGKDHLRSEQYRHSIGSLEYLLRNDTSLLHDFVTTLDSGGKVSDQHDTSAVVYEIAKSAASCDNTDSGKGASFPVRLEGKVSLQDMNMGEGIASGIEQEPDLVEDSVIAHPHPAKLTARDESRTQPEKTRRLPDDHALEQSKYTTSMPMSEDEMRGARVRRYQKLERWFGQAPPPTSSPHSTTYDVVEKQTTMKSPITTPSKATSRTGRSGSSSKLLVTDEVHVISSPRHQLHGKVSSPSLKKRASVNAKKESTQKSNSDPDAKPLEPVVCPSSKSLAQELDDMNAERLKRGKSQRSRPSSLASLSIAPASPALPSASLFWQKTKGAAQHALLHRGKTLSTSASSSALKDTARSSSPRSAPWLSSPTNTVKVSTSIVTERSPRDDENRLERGSRPGQKSVSTPARGLNEVSSEKKEGRSRTYADDSIEKLLSSLEEEVKDDRQLSAAERQDFERRLLRLKMQQKNRREGTRDGGSTQLHPATPP